MQQGCAPYLCILGGNVLGSRLFSSAHLELSLTHAPKSIGFSTHHHVLSFFLSFFFPFNSLTHFHFANSSAFLFFSPNIFIFLMMQSNPFHLFILLSLLQCRALAQSSYGMQLQKCLGLPLRKYISSSKECQPLDSYLR